MTILRDDTDSRIEQLVLELLKNERAKVVVMFANEDNAKRVLKALLKINTTSEFTFLASDSWGAKIHPVKGQETAAEGAVTLLPKRHVIKGECLQKKIVTRSHISIYYDYDNYKKCSCQCTCMRRHISFGLKTLKKCSKTMQLECVYHVP